MQKFVSVYESRNGILTKNYVEINKAFKACCSGYSGRIKIIPESTFKTLHTFYGGDNAKMQLAMLNQSNVIQWTNGVMLVKDECIGNYLK